jgi:hypothetical protein
MDKGRNEFELLNDLTITTILSVRCTFVNHCKSKTGFHKRHRLIATRDIHDRSSCRMEWNVAPKQCAGRQRRCVVRDPPCARNSSDPGAETRPVRI